MATKTCIQFSRRGFLGTGALAAVALATPGIASAATIVQSGNGVTGGGSLATEAGPANFSIFAARFETDDTAAPVISGEFKLIDPGQRITIESLETIDFGPVEGKETVRRIAGFARMSGQGTHPFLIEVTDGGPPGSGFDELNIVVGADGAADTAEVFYEMSGKLETGDLQLLEFTFGD